MRIGLAISAVFIVSAVAATSVLAQDPQLLSFWGRGSNKAAASIGDLVAFGDGRMVRLVDIEDPGNPILLGSVPVGSVVRDLAASSSMFYAADLFGRVYAIGVSDPAAPISTELGPLGPIVDVQNEVLYAHGSEFVAYSLVDPTAPEELSSFKGPFASGVVHTDGVAAILARDSTILIDTSDPSDIKQVGKIDVPRLRVGAASGNTLYLSAGDTLRIFDVTDQSLPVELGKTAARGYGVCHFTDHVFVSDFSGVVRVVSVSDPSDPSEIAFVESQYEATRVGTISTHPILCLGDVVVSSDFNRGIQFFDATDPGALQPIGTLPVAGQNAGVTTRGDRVYVSASNGVFTLDITDPTQPVELSETSVEYEGRFYPYRDFTLVAAADRGIYEVDFSNPDLAAQGRLVANGNATAVTGTLLVTIAPNSTSMSVYDLSQWPGVPVLGSQDIPANSSIIEAFDGIVYTVNRDGLAVTSVADPTTPMILTTLDLPDIRSIEPDSARLFVGSNRELLVFDTSDPALLIPEDTLSYFGAVDVKRYGNRLYVLTSRRLSVLDVSDRESPVELGSYESLSSFFTEMHVTNNYVVLRSVENGVEILTNPFGITTSADPIVTLPRLLELSAFPNPFTDRVRLHLESDRVVPVHVDVFDVTGRRVAHLTSAAQTGARTLELDGSDWAPGVYVVRVRTEQSEATRSLVKLR